LRFDETVDPGTDIERDGGHEPFGTFGVHQMAGTEASAGAGELQNTNEHMVRLAGFCINLKD
jgi:hypothetical protein